jgi:uncharacterized SAM-binding protein YcdF (DUF218 family)
VLVWTAALRLGIDAIPDFKSPHIVLLAGILGAFVARTRARVIFGILSALVCVALLLVMFTPLAAWAVKGVVREDTLQSVPAVVVLDSEVRHNDLLTDRAQPRILYALELLRQGLARELVVTRRVPPERSSVPAVHGLMSRLRFDYPVQEVGLVENTHDEALAVATLARQRGWSEVILVSHPAHMRRAAATFEKAGLHVLCAPCPEGRYDITELQQPDDRLLAFRDWLHESLGYRIYRLRGWL